jgi:membrane protease YdiL (CAAX protease family)
MTASTPRASRPLLASLVLGAALVAAVGVVGWLLLLLVKGTVVLVGWALGLALIAVPLLLARRIVGGHTGVERRQRLWTIAQAVGIGVALCAIAYFVDDHGWLLVVVPAAVVAVLRAARAVQVRREERAVR